MGLSAFVMLIGSLVIWAELLIRSALIYLLVALGSGGDRRPPGRRPRP